MPDLDSNACYILGVLYGDGSIHPDNGTWAVDLTVRDRAFAKSFRDSLRRLGHNVHIHPSIKKWKGRKYREHRVATHSKIIGELYKKVRLRGLDRPPLIKALIRGFYESEGTIKWINDGKGRRIKMDNADKELLLTVLSLLKKIGFTFNFGSYKKRETGKTYYYIDTAREKQINDFLGTIKPCIKVSPRGGV